MNSNWPENDFQSIVLKFRSTYIYIIIYTVGELKDLTTRTFAQIASSVSGAGVNPPFCKMGTFFLGSLALSIPIYRNFQ